MDRRTLDPKCLLLQLILLHIPLDLADDILRLALTGLAPRDGAVLDLHEPYVAGKTSASDVGGETTGPWPKGWWRGRTWTVLDTDEDYNARGPVPCKSTAQGVRFLEIGAEQFEAVAMSD